MCHSARPDARCGVYDGIHLEIIHIEIKIENICAKLYLKNTNFYVYKYFLSKCKTYCLKIRKEIKLQRK